MPILALKVDINTYSGIKSGLPKILDTLSRKNLPASFYISFGPDRTGLTLLQMLRPRLFARMIRSYSVGRHDLKAAIYGLLKKPPMVGMAFPEILRLIKDIGHDVACHAWDNRIWQDWLPLMSRQYIKSWLTKMTTGYMETFGTMPEAFGAPGWRMDKRSLDIVGSFSFSHLSCTRAQEPFIFEENGLLEIPSNLPCIKETGVEGVADALKTRVNTYIPQVLPVHAETEGLTYLSQLESILDLARSLGYIFARVSDIAQALYREDLCVRGLAMARIPGRVSKCAV